MAEVGVIDEEDIVDLDDLIKHYSYCYPRPIFALAQDIQRQAASYINLLEEIKKCSWQDIAGPDPASPDPTTSTKGRELRQKYEKLGLIPAGVLPNPSLGVLCGYVTDKISRFATCLAELLARYGRKFVQELRIEAEATVILQATMTWPPSFTIGIEYTQALPQPVS